MIFWSLEMLWLLLGVACLLAAACLVWPSGCGLPGTPSRSIEALLSQRRAALALWVAVFPLLFGLYKTAQFGAFQSMEESAVTMNVIWNFAHGHGLTSSIYAGLPYTAIHFSFTMGLLSPLLRLSNSPLLFVWTHGLVLGSTLLAVYLITERVTGHAWAAFLGALLALANPLFHGLIIAFIHNCFATPLFLWAVYFYLIGRRGWATVFVLLLVTTQEQVPFMFFGVGLLALVQARTPSRRLAALAIMFGSALLWFGEMSVIHRSRRETEIFDYWYLYERLGGSLGGVVETSLRRPWVILGELVYPPVKVWTVFKTLFNFGFLPLASGAPVLIAVCTWFPQQLATASFPFHRLEEHYGEMILGPLLVAQAYGMSRVLSKEMNRHRPMICGILLVAGFNLLRTGDFRPPEGSLPTSWLESVPRAAAFIPADAKLWCDPFLSSHFALRRYIKVLPAGPNLHFDTALFLPDRILLSTYWIRQLPPGYWARFRVFLEKRGFVAVFRDRDLVVLAHPDSPASLKDLETPLEWIKIP
jgi:uncharacterized membrane protein